MGSSVDAIASKSSIPKDACIYKTDVIVGLVFFMGLMFMTDFIVSLQGVPLGFPSYAFAVAALVLLFVWRIGRDGRVAIAKLLFFAVVPIGYLVIAIGKVFGDLFSECIDDDN
jgi:hypothetical protein